MLKTRVIPILTFNGFGLVKTKQFSNPRMVGNPVQAARVFNSRNVDELIFLDIFCTTQNRKINLKVVKDVIKECFMPVGIGGGIKTIEDINDLLKVGADKVVLKSHVIENPTFIKEAAYFFGSQCISISIDVYCDSGLYYVHNNLNKVVRLDDFIRIVNQNGAGEIILNSIDRDGMMNGFDIKLFNYVSKLTNLPIVNTGGGGNLDHFIELFLKTDCEAVGASSIFYFSQFTPFDIKKNIATLKKPVRF